MGSKAIVKINPEKPGRGNFVVRVSGVDEPVIKLLSMTRPFKPMKDLDMDAEIANVLKAIG